MVLVVKTFANSRVKSVEQLVVTHTRLVLLDRCVLELSEVVVGVPRTTDKGLQNEYIQL